jgi:hypothetical protein
MARSQRRTPQDTEATIRSIIRRLDALERRLQGRRGGTQGPSDFERKWQILEEHELREEVERDEAFSKRNPEIWRKMESDRRARNKKTTVLNRRLRAEGLRPVPLTLSLAERVKKLRQLEAMNNARTAKRTASE